ncbi:lytic transglycosylase domain-containing protein [Bacillus sp. FJAT-42315]|uniref:lytic transglycosylase domain-containing protein n=1 Tax=Bacillus sp. FJAT-42315 TaxID=2014077 RepID=UPI000C250A71|nr:lytic transglycosylase domain-containing protein [Bacillus sp. FJAT-42315]
MARRRLKKSVKRTLFLIPLLSVALYMFIIQDHPQWKAIPSASIPEEFIPIYKAAEKEYGVPWELLAAHHRVETKFSQMDPLISPAGAEGPLQFMPCSFVGWEHPTCSGLGKGDIPEKDKTNPEVIKKYGGYGVDANGDGIADPFDIEDAIFSAAYYLQKHGAADGELEKAIFAYNHSDKYVDDVLYYLQEYKSNK